MGTCVLPENIKELYYYYYDEDKEIEEKRKKAQEKLNIYKQNQKIIKLDKFQLERIKKKNLLKKKTHDIHFNIVNNDSILLMSTIKIGPVKTETINTHLESRLFLSSTVKSKKYDIINYPNDVINLINEIRKNPKGFIKHIENAILLIQNYKNKLIYNGNIKVYLNKGEKMFKEAINSLTNSKPMNDLVLNDDISIDLPTEKEYNNDKDFFKKKILKQKKIKKIERYYREAIKDPYIGVLMMIIDDTNKNQGEKRKTILDPELTKAGIKCRFYGNKFLAYFTFSK